MADTVIPEINFRKKDNTVRGFELIDLNAFVNRDRSSLNHDPSLPHRVSFNIIIFVEQGTGFHYIDFKKYLFQSGTFLFISNGQVHAFSMPKTVKGKILLFTEDFLCLKNDSSDLISFFKLFNYDFFSPLHVPEEQELMSLNQTLLGLQMEFDRQGSENKVKIIRSLLTTFIYQVERVVKNGPSLVTNKQWHLSFIRFKKLVESEETRNRSAVFYAKQVGLSYKHLNSICKAIAGKTAKEFIDDWMILEAKRMLVSTDFSVKEIAFELEFDEPTNFNKFFRKRVSLTPSQFRLFNQ